MYASQEATIRTRLETIGWFKIGIGVWQDCILSPCLYNLYAKYIMENARMDESQARIKISRRNINNLRYADDTTLMAEKGRGTKEPLEEGEGGQWKTWLKTKHKITSDHGIQPHYFMANRRGKWKVVTDFLFLGSKITVIVTEAMNSEDDCFLAGKLWVTWTVCWKETVLCWTCPYSQGYGLPCGHIQLWELDHKEGRKTEKKKKNRMPINIYLYRNPRWH